MSSSSLRNSSRGRKIHEESWNDFHSRHHSKTYHYSCRNARLSARSESGLCPRISCPEVPPKTSSFVWITSVFRSLALQPQPESPSSSKRNSSFSNNSPNGTPRRKRNRASSLDQSPTLPKHKATSYFSSPRSSEKSHRIFRQKQATLAF